MDATSPVDGKDMVPGASRHWTTSLAMVSKILWMIISLFIKQYPHSFLPDQSKLSGFLELRFSTKMHNTDIIIPTLQTGVNI